MINFIEHLEGIITSKIATAKGMYTLFKLEAQLAGLNIVPLLISLGALVALCFSGWLTFIVLIGYLLMFLISPLLAIIIVFILNIIALIITAKRIASCIRQMSFEKTRALLTNQPKESHELAKTTTALHKSARN
ncbi:hypothetical protein [Legionella jamestowniensis]|uniref:Transmembrane protein n=1 Tax=Legionella jamestowniensis TaxID=455 RepID=A0A0W0V114_9GAMM|nr:hypothetical protein [Legionella jamestowniensis]KTD13401.1 hypothetical protein Ljam_0191 [Legionella jamestowniensis]OCH98422.1 hypothetical protein A8135_12800 [Legionella jamestowniensis]SFL75955.1 hypothetical protein SAMN02746073_1735 [Legionella jamestowniensis DSM 19215]